MIGTCLPQGMNFKAEVSWYVSSMPVPIGPIPVSTSTSPGLIASPSKPFSARIAARSEVKTRAGPRCR